MLDEAMTDTKSQAGEEGRADAVGALRDQPTQPRRPRRSTSSTQPRNPDSVREQIAWEAENVAYRSERHDTLAARWDAVASWARVAVTLTSGVSALSIVADSIVLATTFAIITAALAALNAGFSPPEKAKNNRDAARSYGHLERPLGELLYMIDSASEMEYVPKEGVDDASGAPYDAGYYRITGSRLTDDDLRDIWSAFSKERARIEDINEAAPSLAKLWPSWRTREAQELDGRM